MAHWKEILTKMVADAESQMDTLRYRLQAALGGPGPVKIVTYRGYGTAEQLYLRGRVLEDKYIPEAEQNDRFWENLLYMFRRMESDEVPHARLMARFQGQELEIEADEEGYFEVTVTPSAPLAPDHLWHSVELELLSPIPRKQEQLPVKASGEVLVPPPTARYVVVSDIDDTVLQSDATHLIKMARHVFLGNAHTRLPFPGVAALYRALFHGKSGDEMNPLFYVSSSPWNLYDLLSQFFHLQDIPIGPVLFLRDWGISEDEILPTGHHKHKIGVIRRMLESYRNMPFILVGDSGQADPEIYAELVEQYPERIQAVYIRNVSHDLKRPEAIRDLAKKVVEAGSALVLADDSLTIAQHAVEQGYIPVEALAAIGLEKEKDEAPPTAIEKMLGEEPGQAPTVVVEGKEAKERKGENTGPSAK
jgi:phosphatidate phosphatase APP1